MCTKKRSNFKHSSKRHTEETLHKPTPWYLHQAQADFVLCPQSLHPVQTRLKVWLFNGGYHMEFYITRRILR